MTTVRLPLAGSQINTRNGSLAYDALLQNCIVEKAGDDPAVMKRDCYTAIYTPSAGYLIQGMWEFGRYRDWETDRKSTRLNSSHRSLSRMPSSA